MMDFIAVPLVVGMITLGIYKFFELLICRRERLNIIEKIEPGALIDYVKNVNLGMPGRAAWNPTGFSSWALRLGCLLAGLGLGLLVAYWTVGERAVNPYNMSAIYGGSVLCFGGLGLVVAFVVERLIGRRERA